MSEPNKMRIICDPYEKKIEYQWFNSEGKYVELSTNSKLVSDKFTNATIQNRAYEIVTEINKECSAGNVGLEITFVGTEDDYCDFHDVILKYFSEYNISCVRDENLYYNRAKDVMPEIRKKFSEINDTLKEYPEDKITELVNKYNDVVKPHISLCVIGLYSAGKSAFINSIIGAEILPSAKVPTTAKVFKIHCDQKYEIRFWFDDKECVLSFEGTSYKPNNNCVTEIIEELQHILDSEGPQNEVFYMNRALEILNNYKNDNHNISEIIEIYIPFIRTKLPVEEFDFVIYDTPGSNSEENEKHFKTLEESLDNQTNALPIFVTNPETMDAKDNKEILELIEKEGKSLDTANAIVIVNKADEASPRDLQDIVNNFKKQTITKWNSTRVFFVSSVVAIASKKENPDKIEEWLDKNMQYYYNRVASECISDERKLFEYNMIDKSKEENIAEYKDSENSTHLYKNSGLESVEREIVEYSRKYASYNKCHQASEYLQKAINLCVENIQKDETDLSNALKEAREHFDSKKNELCDKLEANKNLISEYNTQFQAYMNTKYNAFVSKNNLKEDENSDKRILHEKLKNEWKDLKEVARKEKRDKKWIFSQIEQYANNWYNELLESFSDDVNEHIVEFWNKRSEEFRTICWKSIVDTDALTNEQKEIMKSVVFSEESMPTNRIIFDLRKKGVIKHKRFIRWELESEKFDFKACCDNLINGFNSEVGKRIHKTENENGNNFNNWVNNLINILQGKLCIFNSGLSSYEQKIEKFNADIKAKEACKQLLNDSKEYIDNLLALQGGEIDG